MVERLSETQACHVGRGESTVETLVLRTDAMTPCVLGMHGEVASSARQSDSEAFRAHLTCRDAGGREIKSFPPLSGI